MTISVTSLPTGQPLGTHANMQTKIKIIEVKRKRVMRKLKE
jgi:hypothetical protein